MPKVTVRLAENAEGERVKYVLEQQHGKQEDWLRWDQISPYWLVAEIDGEIVGCIQTRPSRPIGGLENLATLRRLSDVERGLVVRNLVLSGSAVLVGHGCQIADGFIPFELRSYKRVLKKRGAVVSGQGNLMARRIA
jgi:hypothetical protein